jgi:hypothetical protein
MLGMPEWRKGPDNRGVQVRLPTIGGRCQDRELADRFSAACCGDPIQPTRGVQIGQRPGAAHARVGISSRRIPVPGSPRCILKIVQDSNFHRALLCRFEARFRGFPVHFRRYTR